MVHSLNKGKNFEREIANLLTETTGTKWQRVPMSGAFSTTNNSEDPRFSGDVFSEDSEYKNLVIECKSYKDLSINDLFNNKSKFWDWIRQSEIESKGKQWILFIKIKNKGIFFVTYCVNLKLFERLNYDCYPYFCFNGNHYDYALCKINKNYMKNVITDIK